MFRQLSVVIYLLGIEAFLSDEIHRERCTAQCSSEGETDGDLVLCQTLEMFTSPAGLKKDMVSKHADADWRTPHAVCNFCFLVF